MTEDAVHPIVPGEGPTRVDALCEIDLTVTAGELISLPGPVSWGKTTLLNVIGRILVPSTGRVTLDGNVAPDLRLGAQQAGLSSIRKPASSPSPMTRRSSTVSTA